MRYFLIDDLRAEETKRLCEHLDAMDLGAGLDEEGFVDGVDVQTCRDTFKLVFDTMQQSQHYEMMMKQN